ncbi:uncharacterized protein LOC113074420 isoform X3 [Carassius auratus]|uniref:Uncharacterized protein LOC113074420 isoform X3 n=1 Tax=Carassius auratus TaxID=7957 RepID=A0A6P6N211_CARAU|nr:uncharacterized protein LOC113074420 isoform X3 [Carassius auratus]
MLLAQQLHPGLWKEYGRDDLNGAPRQNWSNNCGVFVLMSDMAAVRRWWCLLLLTNYPVKSDAERKLLRKRRKEMKTGELEKEAEADYISKQMPPEILRRILLNVVKEDGDVAFFRLCLTCWLFHDVVCDASFRKDAHLAWLDSVVNWSAYSSDYKEMYRVPYKVTSCLCCGDLFKDFPPGYIGDGRKGILRAFYSTKEFEGYCSADCFICDGNHYSPKDNNL